MLAQFCDKSLKHFREQISSQIDEVGFNQCPLSVHRKNFSQNDVAVEVPDVQTFIRSQFIDFQFLIRCFTRTIMYLYPYIAGRCFSQKNLEKYDARKIIACYTLMQKGIFGCCEVDRHVCQHFLHRYTYLVCTSLVMPKRKIVVLQKI